MRLRPEYHDLRLALARVLFEDAKLDDAAAELDRVLQQNEDYDDAQLLRGRIELERGRPEAARAAWRRVRVGTAAVQARAWLERLGRREHGAGTVRGNGSGSGAENAEGDASTT